ncbi:MAG: Ldh family oxidoreductase [Eggerthellales bacterium]|nr:Ldh family oxidoreductase [Eggerthellales bacterium]
MAHMYFPVDLLNRFCNDAFEKFGFTADEAQVITDVLLLSDKYGIESHGMQRLSRYHKGIEKGMIKPEAKPEVVFESPVSAVIDGHDGMGQLIGKFAMEKCIEKAKTTGMAVVSVRNSNHYGIAGYYAKMAVDQGLIGMSFTNSEAIMVPTFGSKAMLGSNPIALAVPADPHPFIYDASTTVVTRGKLEMYRKAEKPLPDGWALDKNGRPSNDAEDVLKNILAKAGGGIMPLGASEEITGSHKGFGYGMICEIFCSILSQGLTSNHTHTDGKGGTCHGFVAIDPAAFGDPDQIKAHFSVFLQELRDAPKAEGHDRIYCAGDKEVEALDRALTEGIAVDVKTVIEMKQMCEYLGLDFTAYFGDVKLDESGFTTLY